MIDLWLPFKISRQLAEGRLLCPEHKDAQSPSSST